MLPKRYISPIVSKVDQKHLNFCVSNAITTAIEIKMMMQLGTTNIPDLSRMYLQRLCKLVDGAPNEQGTFPTIAFSQARKYGTCEESLYPYVIDKNIENLIFPSVTEEMKENAKKYKIGDYKTIGTVSSIKEAIYNNGAVILSNKVFTNVADCKDGFTAKPQGRYNYEHCTCVIGYDDEYEREINGVKYKGFFVRINTSNPWLYNDGYEYFPYEAITNWSCDGKRWFARAYDFDMRLEPKYPNFLKDNQPNIVIPDFSDNYSIELKIDSNVAKINGVDKTLSFSPIIVDGTTMIGIRVCDLFENTSVTWDNLNKIAIVMNKDNKYYFKLGRKEILDSKDNIIYVSIVEPKLINGSTMIPLRALSTCLGYKITFDNTTKIITIKR